MTALPFQFHLFPSVGSDRNRRKRTFLHPPLMSLLLALTLFSAAEPASANVKGIVEFPIPYTSLLTFSSSQLTAKLCTGCAASTIYLNSNTSYYRHNDAITFQQATELYVARQYKTISLFIDTRDNTLDLIRFGEFLENMSDSNTGVSQ